MKSILKYITDYFRTTDKRMITIVSLFTAAFVFLNYRYSIDYHIRKNNSLAIKLIIWYAVFLLALGIPYVCWFFFRPQPILKKRLFLFLLFIAPAIFAFKISADLSFRITKNDNWNNYWNHVFYWPLLFIITTISLLLIWRYNKQDEPFYGLKFKGINWKPYWLMLLIMIPLIAAASTQPDFLAMYPKMQTVSTIGDKIELHWWHKLLYELSYGTDFISIELFFRGFLVLGFLKWAGKDAILPMACFYCTIHFGKPLAECISSYFGGILLGIVVYNTRSIAGGLLVHLGIAWLMEIGGYIGNTFIR
jgi:hypothetical protein